MDISLPVFAGFFPKITVLAPDGLGVASVEQIASISECISPGPPDWIQRWQHNNYGFFDTETLALSVVGEGKERYDLYAYKVFPLRALGEVTEYVTLQSVNGDIPIDFEFLGYDIVSKSNSDLFECSPLSCNYAARLYSVNRWCLIAVLEAAYQALQEISREGTYEPGPYYLFEVYRKGSELDINKKPPTP